MGLVKEHRMNPANEAWLKGLQDVQEKCLPAPCEGCRLPLAQKCLMFTCYYSMGYYPRRLNATGWNHYLSLEGSWMVWTLACVHGPCLGIMYSLKGCFHSPSKQKLGEGLAKLRTAREAPSDCVCPPGRCQVPAQPAPHRPGATCSLHPRHWAPPFLHDMFLFIEENVLRSVFFPELKHSVVLEIVNFSQCLALAYSQIKEFEVWTKAMFGYKNKRLKNLTGLWALGVGPKQFRSSNKITGA